MSDISKDLLDRFILAGKNYNYFQTILLASVFEKLGKAIKENLSASVYYGFNDKLRNFDAYCRIDGFGKYINIPVKSILDFVGTLETENDLLNISIENCPYKIELKHENTREF